MPIKRVHVLTPAYYAHGTLEHDKPFNLWLNDPQRKHLLLKEAVVYSHAHTSLAAFTVPEAVFPIQQVVFVSVEANQSTTPLGTYRLKLVVYTAQVVAQGYFPVTSEMKPADLLHTRARFLLASQVRLHPLVPLRVTLPSVAPYFFLNRDHLAFYHAARS